MKKPIIIALIVVIAAITAGIMIMPSTTAMAASIADSVGRSNNNDPSLSTSGSTEPKPATEPNATKVLVLTAVPERTIISAGSTESIDIKAAAENGTGISDATVQALVLDYATGKQKVLLGGQTDTKGELKVSATIGPSAKAGQFLVIVNGTKGDMKNGISTGFAVTEKGSGSSSGSGGSSKCSGSSCK